jgi:hypothetical protein
MQKVFSFVQVVEFVGVVGAGKCVELRGLRAL